MLPWIDIHAGSCGSMATSSASSIVSTGLVTISFISLIFIGGR